MRRNGSAGWIGTKADWRFAAGAAILMIALMIAMCTPPAFSSKKQAAQPFPHAYATRGCTQEDAPALEIYLTKTPYAGDGEPAAPYLRIEISSSPQEEITPSSLELIQLRRNPAKRGRIARAQLVEPDREPVWLSGVIELKEAIPGARVAGRYDVTASSRRHWIGTFTTMYTKRSAVCG